MITRRKPLRRGKPPRRVSLKLAARRRIYSKQRRVFLTKNPLCAVCKGVASQVHHRAGRNGERLNDKSEWVAVCPVCHEWIHRNPLLATKVGLLKRRMP